MRVAALIAGMALAAGLALSTSCEPDTSAVLAKYGPTGVCATCHLSDYLAVRHPVHAGVKPTTCGICHSSDSWHPAVLNHPWPLTGAHAKADCSECHRGTDPVYRGTKSECVDCHRADYDGSRFPGHSRFPLTCAECHSTTAWSPTLEAARTPQPRPAENTPVPQPAPPREAPKSGKPSPRPSPAPRPLPTPTPQPRPTSTPPPDSVTGASRHRR
jgi:hypothetical protein